MVTVSRIQVDAACITFQQIVDQGRYIADVHVAIAIYVTVFHVNRCFNNRESIEWQAEAIGAGAMETVDALNDTTPYYLVKKDGLKLLVNIHDYILEVIELPENTNVKNFVYGKNKFKQFKKLELIYNY